MATGNDEKHKLEENLKAETSKEESQQKDNPPTAENPNSDPTSGTGEGSTPQPESKPEENPKPEAEVDQPDPASKTQDEKQDQKEPQSDPKKEDDHHEEYEFDDEDHHEDQHPIHELNEEELLERIKDYSGRPIESISEKVINEIHKFFYQKIKQMEDEAKEKFVKEGNDEADFEFRAANEIISHFEDYYKSFKEKKRQFHGELEKTKERNVEKKEELLERLRKMVDGDVDHYDIKVLREIEEEWRQAEPVLPARAREFWANFNALRDRFYDQRSILYELKDLDRKKNQTLKEEIIEKAEQLLSKESMVNAVAELKKLHEEYKHIGPVPREVRAKLWERFKEISDKIHDKRREVSVEFKKVLEENQKRKEELIQKIADLKKFSSDRINEWNSKTKEVLAMQEEWKKIGPTPKSSAKEISRQFWADFKGFFKQKQAFFKEIDKKRNENLETKIHLCEEVERIKDSEDWGSTAKRIKEIQKEWRDVGPVPRKKSEQVYQRFKGLCDEFFNRRRELMEERSEEFKENLDKKNAICDEIDKMKGLSEENFPDVQQLVRDWMGVGFVMRDEIKNSKDRLKNSLKGLLEKADKDSEGIQDTELKIESLLAQVGVGGGPRAIQTKIDKFKKQIGQLQREAENLKDNVEMFARSDEANKIRADVEGKIRAAEEKIRSLKNKIKILRD